LKGIREARVQANGLDFATLEAGTVSPYLRGTSSSSSGRRS
jgi:hypothetical protein